MIQKLLPLDRTFLIGCLAPKQGGQGRTCSHFEVGSGLFAGPNEFQEIANAHEIYVDVLASMIDGGPGFFPLGYNAQTPL